MSPSRHFELSVESFLYLCSKVPSASKASLMHNEASFMYNNKLCLKARTGDTTKIYIRILHLQALSEFCNILGACVGLGISSSCQMKQNKFKYCTINGMLSSVELLNTIRVENIQSSLRRTGSNRIDFICSAKSRQYFVQSASTSYAFPQQKIILL
jgi:hypothetical protein